MCVILGVRVGAKSSRVNADNPNWLIKEYSSHTPMCAEICSSTIKPVYEERIDMKGAYSKFSVTPLLKNMVAPALVSACIMNRNLQPKDAKFILQSYVVRELPAPFVSKTLKIAKDIAKSGASTSVDLLSKLQGHADLLRSFGHHCEVEVTDYGGMIQVREY